MTSVPYHVGPAKDAANYSPPYHPARHGESKQRGPVKLEQDGYYGRMRCTDPPGQV